MDRNLALIFSMTPGRFMGLRSLILFEAHRRFVAAIVLEFNFLTQAFVQASEQYALPRLA